MSENIKAGVEVELADKEAGFTDMITGFDLSRDQKKKLEDPIGDRTHQAIMSGVLLVVGSKPKKAADKADEKDADAGK